MAADEIHPAKRTARGGRLRRALPAAGQVLGAAMACGLWLGVASPGLELLPGVGGLADESIEISLQSAMLGIDDGSGRPASAEALAAADVLGLSYLQQLAASSPAGAAIHAASDLVRLDPVAAQLAAPFARPDEGAAPSSPSESADPVAEPELVAAAPSAAAPEEAATVVAEAAPRPAPAAPRPAPAAVSEPAAPPRAQSVVFSSDPPAEPVVGGSYRIAASASSGLPVKLSASESRGACKLHGSTVSFRSTGTCVVVARQPGNDRYAPADARQELEIGRAGQTVAFASTPPSPALVGGAYAVVATASSGLPVSFSIAPGSGCTITGATVAFTKSKRCAVVAEQNGNGSFAAAAAVQQSFEIEEPYVPLLAQSIAFTSSAPAGATVGGAAYAVSALATSGLAVTFSLAPSSAGVCSLLGSTIAFVGVGTCTVRADQAGGLSFLAAAQVQQSFAVGKAPQTVSFSSAAPGAAVFGGPDYTVAASASSGLAVSLSVDPGSAAVCSLAGSSVSLLGAGTCVVLADQAGDAVFQPAAQAQQAFAVAKASQTVSFTSSAPAGAAFGGPGYTVAATASSGLAVSFSVAPASAGVCALSGSTVSLTGVGTCTILADQAGGVNHDAAAQAQQSFPVAKAAQSISFTSTPPAGAVFGGPGYTVAATTTSGLPVAFSVAPSSAAVCALAGSSVSILGAGTCTIRANQAGDGSYEAAAQAEQSFAAAKAAQSIAFTSIAPGSAVFGGAGYTVSATATSGLAVSFSIAPASAGVCSLSGSSVSIAGAGTCTVLADQSGNADYEAAPQVQQSFAVAKAAQSASFTSTAPSGAVLGGPAYTVTATATSGLAVSYSIAAASAGVCSLSGSTVSPTGVGTCTILADQAGSADYEAAAQVQQSFAVAKAAQSISFGSTPPSGAVYAGPAYTVAATASSGLPVSFSLAPASAGVCTVTGASVTLVGVGTCTILADQAGSADYEAAPQVQQSFAVAKAPQAITFTSTPPVVDGSVFFYNVSATAGSGLSVGFSLSAGSSGVCSLFGAWVFFYGNGTCVVRGNQAGDASWLPAPQVQQSIVVTGH